MTFSNSLVEDTNQQIPKCVECETLYKNKKKTKKHHGNFEGKQFYVFAL